MENTAVYKIIGSSTFLFYSGKNLDQDFYITVLSNKKITPGCFFLIRKHILNGGYSILQNKSSCHSLI